MVVEILNSLSVKYRKLWENLLNETELFVEDEPDTYVLVFEGEELIATGSRKKNILKYLAVSPKHQGEDLTATLLTNLKTDAINAGYKHLFLFTKPKNLLQFNSLFFYPIAKTGNILLMENEKNGISNFLNQFDSKEFENAETVGSAVMNCNPFTKGHRALIEQASLKCDKVVIFVLSEENGDFPASDRLKLVKEGVKDLKNVTVLPSGPYLISSATFPTYFLKDRDNKAEAQCQLDIEIFSKHYAPKFKINKRIVAEEPFSALTNKYNECLKENLPKNNIELLIVPRIKFGDKAISATEVRKLIKENDCEKIKNLVPDVTYNYLCENGYIKEN